MMRIITGKAKGIKLNTLEGIETRPTAERVKEAIFSMIQFDIEERKVLDLFSGTGQIGLEAVSRGASCAVLVDRSKNAIKIIEGNAEKTHLKDQCTIINSDATDFIKRNKGNKFDIIFIDPPYASGLYAPILLELKNCDMLKPTTLIICENDYEGLISENKVLEEIYSVKKASKYSKTVITVLEVIENDK